MHNRITKYIQGNKYQKVKNNKKRKERKDRMQNNYLLMLEIQILCGITWLEQLLQEHHANAEHPAEALFKHNKVTIEFG